MHPKLHWHTVSPTLKSILDQLMRSKLFDEFRLVGGTSLSLQLGHRVSVDIDLFTAAPYNSIDFDLIDDYLRATFPFVSESTPGQIGMGRPYFIGEREEESVKLDLYYTDPFIQDALITDNIRMATIEEIIAMKRDIIQRGGRKKDFWDLHELLDKYSPEQMIGLHTEFSNADDDFEPICLKGKYWEIIKLEIANSISRQYPS